MYGDLRPRNQRNQWSVAILPPAPQFIRGDSNLDGVVNISDGVRIVRHLFAGVQIGCQDALDANDDGRLNVTDAIRVLDFLYRGGRAPSAPYPAQGRDASDTDELWLRERSIGFSLSRRAQ